MENTIISLQTRNTFLEQEVTGYKALIFHEQKRRKRSKKLIEEFRAEEGHTALFMLPSKI